MKKLTLLAVLMLFSHTVLAEVDTDEPSPECKGVKYGDANFKHCMKEKAERVKARFKAKKEKEAAEKKLATPSPAESNHH